MPDRDINASDMLTALFALAAELEAANRRLNEALRESMTPFTADDYREHQFGTLDDMLDGDTLNLDGGASE